MPVNIRFFATGRWRIGMGPRSRHLGPLRERRRPQSRLAPRTQDWRRRYTTCPT